MMKKQCIALALLLQLPLATANDVPFSLMQISNFTVNSKQLATSGQPQLADFVQIKAQGYQHVINLIPGDFSQEAKQVTDLQMTFDQIKVNWHEPTLQNFKDFTKLMNKYAQHKVLVHCQVNYRASTFTYLYLVTQKGVVDNVAKQNLLSVWQPQPNWQKFIDKVKHHYSHNT